MTKPGDRIRLVSTTDEHTHLKPGDLGQVQAVDSFGTLHVLWDSGSRLGLIPGEDVWEPDPGEATWTVNQWRDIVITCPACKLHRTYSDTVDNVMTASELFKSHKGHSLKEVP